MFKHYLKFAYTTQSSRSLKNYCDTLAEFDPCLRTPDHGNPWVGDNSDWFEEEKSMTAVPRRRYALWTVSILDLLRDEAGREQYHAFLDKEFCAENLE